MRPTESSNRDSHGDSLNLALDIKGLQKRYGDKFAVAGLDLEVPAGEFFCFLGPNGAGKTTTIKMLTGLVRPTAGRALVCGHDIQTDAVAAKRCIGYVPDTPFLYEKLTAREMMRFVAGLYSMNETRFTELCDPLLDTFELSHVADQLIERYSHGMRQKLSFATCFLHEPRIVIVDEPWVGLDPKNIRRLKSFLRAKANSGVTVFMSTHTLSIVEEIADRVGIIHQGSLLALGSLAGIKSLATSGRSLEEVFLQLTAEDEAEDARPSAAATIPSRR